MYISRLSDDGEPEYEEKSLPKIASPGSQISPYSPPNRPDQIETQTDLLEIERISLLKLDEIEGKNNDVSLSRNSIIELNKNMELETAKLKAETQKLEEMDLGIVVLGVDNNLRGWIHKNNSHKIAKILF